MAGHDYSPNHSHDTFSIDAVDGLRDLIAAADETATSNHRASFARFDDDRAVGEWAIVPGASIHRDSDTLDRSNAERIREDIEASYPGALVVEGASHWAVGWTEAALVPVYFTPDGVEPRELSSGAIVYTGKRPVHGAAIMAASIGEALDDYPVYDETHFSELEHNELVEGIEQYAAGDALRAHGYDVTSWAPDDWIVRTLVELDLNVSTLDEWSDDVEGRALVEHAATLGYVMPDGDIEAIAEYGSLSARLDMITDAVSDALDDVERGIATIADVRSALDGSGRYARIVGADA